MRQNICKYIEDCAKVYGECVALYEDTKEYTFATVEKKVVDVAITVCQEMGVCRNKPIAVFMDKGIDAIIAFLGVLYSNNFYAPLDCKAPVERLKKIISVLQPKCIITQSKYLSVLNDIVEDVPKIIWENIENSEKEQYSDILATAIDTDPAYILFTSGSTGIPKGVLLSHRAVIDRISWMCEMFNINSNFVFGNQAPFYFDASMPDIYIPFFSGAKISVIPEELFCTPMNLIDYINRHKVNALIWVPTALIMLAERDYFASKIINQLDLVIFCGEVMPTRYINHWIKYYPATRFINMYGPTEAAYACTYYEIKREFKNEDALPIGNACGNTDVFLLDEQDHLVEEQGVEGEICIRGTTLAYGYYNDDRTKASFIQNPLNKAYYDIIYRTGDIAKYNQYGELLFQGRKDSQIKRRGYRIELGEIESAVYTIGYIKQNCAIYDTETKKLAVVCSLYEVHLEKEIYQAIKKKVPNYMLPDKIVILEELPLNANGKIDRLKIKQELLAR